MRQLYERLKNTLQGEVLWQELMSNHTTFRIGGPADIMIQPNSIEDLIRALGIIKDVNVPYLIIGAGSNLLVRDKGIRGVVIKIGSGFDEISVTDQTLTAGSGATLTKIARTAQKFGLKGLEFAVGIPGTVGGALVMNAGAYGGEISQVLQTATVLTKDGQIKTLENKDLHFGYRHSRFLEEKLIALSATFFLEKEDKEIILNHMRELTEKRRSKQPIHMPCAGSVFRRPPDCYVGPMVENAGLKGYRIGGAEVSTKHAGFIVNVGGATCKDVLDLINFIQETIKNKYGVSLEPEIKVVGEV